MVSVDWTDCPECMGKGFAIHVHEKNRIPCVKCGGGGQRPQCPDCDILMSATRHDRYSCHQCGLTVRED